MHRWERLPHPLTASSGVPLLRRQRILFHSAVLKGVRSASFSIWKEWINSFLSFLSVRVFVFLFLFIPRKNRRPRRIYTQDERKKRKRKKRRKKKERKGKSVSRTPSVVLFLRRQQKIRWSIVQQISIKQLTVIVNASGWGIFFPKQETY